MNAQQQMNMVQQFEKLCTAVYEPDESLPMDQMAKQVTQVQTQIMKIIRNEAFWHQVQIILTKTSNNYAITIASNAYRDFMTQKWNRFSAEDRVKVRHFVMRVMREKMSILTHASRMALINIVTRVSKMGWFDDERHKEVVEEALKLLVPDHPQSYCLGIDLLGQLVDEMNKPLSDESLTDHRKIAVSFRELSLKSIFQAALTCIREVASRPHSEAKIKMCNVGVNLAVKCLKYDFIGTNPDESMLEMSNIHVPTTWRHIMQDKNVVPVLFQVYKGSRPLASGEFPQYVSRLMELFSLLAIVRRSIFYPAEKERLEFLKRMITGACEVLISKHGLSDPDVYHQFCRFLGKLKSNYQLTELVNTDGYQKWIQLASQFSIDSFRRWQLSSSSSHYILQLWSRMVTAMPYVREEAGAGGHLLKEYVPRVLQAYVNGKLQEIEAAVKTQNGVVLVGIDGDVEHPLDDPEVLETHLQFLPTICRYQYREIAEILVGITTTLWSNASRAVQQLYEAAGANNAAAIPQLKVRRIILEDQLAWMTYISSALVAGRLPTLNRRSDGVKEELIDADLSKHVFMMITIFPQWRAKLKPPYKPQEHLEMALLHFFDTFQKTYVGEHRGMPPIGSSTALISSAAPNEKQQMYLRYFERLKMGQHTEVIEKIIARLGLNLQDWGSNDTIIGKTLESFTSFVCGYSSGRLLLELDTVKFIIEHHTEKNFQFLKSKSPKISEHRAQFFHALARLIWLQDGAAKFEKFMATHVRMLGNCLKADFSNANVQSAMVAVCRDLLGVARASHNGRTYRMVFDALHPILFQAMDKALREAGHVPEVSVAVLQLMAELVENKTQRIQFNHCSPSGILLFKYTSQLCCTYVSRMSSITQFSDKYEEKYRPLGLLFEMLHRALNGKYVNFGVFELYKDPCLKRMVDASIIYISKSPYLEMRVFPKVHQALCTYLEALFSNHLDLMMRSYNPNAILELLGMVLRGLEGLDGHVATVCSAAIDHLATYVFEKSHHDPAKDPYAAKVKELKALNENIYYKLLDSLFRIVLFTESGNEWSLSKPILSLMLADQPSFERLKKHYLDTQAINPEARVEMAKAFKELTTEIRPNLEQGNRDRFSQHISHFRTAIFPLLRR